MKRMRITIIVAVLITALLAPGAVFAQNAQNPDPGPEWNIKMEFRYSKGEESKLNVPGSIARYGRTYHLVSKTDPVLESKMPATREYTWLIDGTVSEADKHLVDGIEGVVLTPKDVEIGIVVDKHITRGGLPTNDVDSIPLISTEDEGFYRAAVRFEVEGYDEFGLPVSYVAEIVYRGLDSYIGPGYEVKASYTTSEDLDGVPQYVVVATYAPDGLVPISGGGGGGGGTGVPAADAGAAIADEPLPLGDGGVMEPPLDGYLGIIDDDVPLSDGAEGAGTAGAAKEDGLALWAQVLIIVAAAFAGFFAWALLTRSWYEKKKRTEREEKRRAQLQAHGLVEYDG